jgi:hypothetical protein
MGQWKLKDLFWQTREEEEPDPVQSEASAAAVADEPGQRSAVVQVLELVKDIEGVLGSVAVANTGAVVGHDLPRLFDRERIERLGNRLIQLRAALGAEGSPLKSAVFRYENYDLRLNQLPWGILGVLSEHRADSPALTMALKVIGQRVESTLAAPSNTMTTAQ